MRVIGPRQCGKTTLVGQFVNGDHVYITLDDDTVLAAAGSDPAGFVRARTTNRGGSTPAQAVAARWPKPEPRRSSSIQPRADTSRKLSARRPRRGT